MPNIQAALQAWRDIVGPDNVVTDPEALRAAESATFATTQRVRALLRPGTAAEVRRCVRVASRFHTPLYPVSRGKNWGYGSRVPPRDGSVLLELFRLDRIVDFNEKLSYVTVEPGVSFRQLYEHLRLRGSSLMMSVTGSTPDSSLVGNALERGMGMGPYGDRFAHVCGLEVVLPSGECVHTGFARFRKARAAAVHRWGVGPSLDGLFSQSNLGIVTRMSMWLLPRPRSFSHVPFACHHSRRLGAVIDALAGLVAEGAVRGTFSLWNDYKVAAAMRQAPLHPRGTPLTRRRLTGLLGQRLPRWVGSVPLYALSPQHVRELRRMVESAWHPGSSWAPSPLETGEEDLQTRAFLGVPSIYSLRAAYWRKRFPPPRKIDLDRDRCGFIWFAPLVPANGSEVLAVVQALERILLQHGFEPQLAILMNDQRSVEVVASLVFDREVSGEDERAMACHHAMFQAMARQGYLPYRLGRQSMHLLPSPVDDSVAVLRRIKRALDPDDILASDHYVPS